MGNAWSFGSLVRGLNPRVQSWAEIPPGARPHKAEGLGKFVFWELLAPTKAKRESSRWNHNMKTYKQTNIDGLRKASDAPRHTMVDYIHIIFAHSTIPVCCMFLGVTVLNPKTSICRFAKVFDQWTECPTGERGGKVTRCLNGCASWVVLLPNLCKLHQLSAPQGMVVSSKRKSPQRIGKLWAQKVTGYVLDLNYNQLTINRDTFCYLL